MIHKFRKINVPLLIITMLGLLLRVFKLDAKSLWLDEAFTVAFAQKDWGTIFFHHYSIRPLYFMIVKCWASLFGYTEFNLRMLSVVFGTLSIIMLYRLGKLLFNKKIGLFCALLLALSAYHVIRSQQARWYSLAMLLFISTAFCLLQLRRKPKLFYWIAYPVSLLMLVYTNPFIGGMVFLLTNCFLFLFKIDLKRWMSMQAVIILLASILLIPVLNHYNIEIENDKYCPIVNENIFKMLIEDFSYGRVLSQAGVGGYLDTNRPWITKCGFYMILGLTYLVFLRFLLCKRKSEQKIKFNDGFTILWFFIPFGIFGIVNLFVAFSRWSKIAIILLPAFCLLVGRMFLSLRKDISRLLIGFFVLSYSINLVYYYYAPNQDSWREIAFLVKKNMQKGDSIVFFPMAQITPFWYYYKYNEPRQLKDIGDSFFGKTRKINDKWVKEFYDKDNLITGFELGNIPANCDEVFNPLVRRHAFWIVVSPDWYGRENMRKLKLGLQKNYKLEKESRFVWDGVEVLYYKPDSL
ncbi:MAG: glycosyltransferase family 39 protein [Candidatus Omnitrophota bacterium]